MCKPGHRIFNSSVQSELNYYVFDAHFISLSVQISTNISIAQLSRMSHCALEATLNPIHLLMFMPETVVSNLFVAQVCWEAVPDRGYLLQSQHLYTTARKCVLVQL